MSNMEQISLGYYALGADTRADMDFNLKIHIGPRVLPEVIITYGRHTRIILFQVKKINALIKTNYGKNI